MKIFKLVDEHFDKFSGFSLNIDLAVMLHCGEHSGDQSNQVTYYVMKKQADLEQASAERSL